jgi:hypothetical protein
VVARISSCTVLLSPHIPVAAHGSIFARQLLHLVAHGRITVDAKAKTNGSGNCPARDRSPVKPPRHFSLVPAQKKGGSQRHKNDFKEQNGYGKEVEQSLGRAAKAVTYCV